MTEQQVEKGDQVSWKWGSGRPSGEVAEVAKEGELSVTSNKGNEIKKNASPDDPAVHIARDGNDVVKRAHEVDIDEKAGATAGSEKPSADNETEKKQENSQNGEKKAEQDNKAEPEAAKTNGAAKENGDALKGEKREHEKTEDKQPKSNGDSAKAPEPEKEEEEEEKPAAKKQKTDDADADADASKKGRGRPKKSESNGTKASTKKKEPKPAATADGKPRRSARNRS